jgi:1-acyl-sn-glycerol-3-phosphate acyltransferase
VSDEDAPKPFFDSTAKRVWYDFVRGALAWFSRIFWRMTVEGSEHIPATGAFILAPVHRNNVDTPLVCGVGARRLRYMGKDAMWKYRWSAWFFDSLGGIPVHRGEPDRPAMRRSENVLAAGEPLVMFPEGTRQSGPIVEHVFDGVAYLALRTGTTIVPVGIGGSERALPRGSKMIRPVKVALVIGEPIIVTAPEPGQRVPRRAVKELTQHLTDELQRLFDAAQAKVGA